MGQRQTKFVTAFKEAFVQRFGAVDMWAGGQVNGNLAYLPRELSLRRHGKFWHSERFELGDLRTNLKECSIIVEYDGSGIAIQNLLKYWPYVRGELSVQPELPIVLCHFSDWFSWAVNRDLWQWTLSRIQADLQRKVSIFGHQFDHGGKDLNLRTHAVQEALNWIQEQSAAISQVSITGQPPVSA